MTKQRRPNEMELHAFADHQLDAQRTVEVQQYLDEHPQLNKQVQDWISQNSAIEKLYGHVLDEDIPARLDPANIANKIEQKAVLAKTAGWFNPKAIAASTVIALFGVGIGWALKGHFTPTQFDQQLASAAMNAHATYVVEVAHPVDVSVGEEQHLVSWLSKRLGGKLGAPELTAHGFSLVGGNLLPAGEGPAAQFMYENKSGERITLYATRNRENKLAAFQFASQDNIRTFYWLDTDFSYALVGKVSRQDLKSIAKSVYHQLEDQG